MKKTELLQKKSAPAPARLSAAECATLLKLVPDWHQEAAMLVRTFSFRDYYETLAFINAIAYIIHAEDHHPILDVRYDRCTVRFDTHALADGGGGISENDFICAAKIDTVFEQSFSRL